MFVINPKPEAPEQPVEPLAVNSRVAAKMLGISERTLFKLTKEGKIHHKKIGWRTLIPVASLKAFLEIPATEE